MRTLEAVGQDVRYGLRRLARSPGYTVVVVLTLGLGIGANTAIFSLIHGVLLRPLPYVDGERLIVPRQQALRAGSENIPFSVREIADYREALETVDGFVEHHGMSFTLLDRGEPDRVLTGVVSANFFDVLGVTPLHGRTFVDADDDLGAEAVLVLSHAYWQQRFGADPAVVGEVLEMNDRPHTVVGVLPPIPQYPRENDVYMPTSACPFRARAEARMAENRVAFRAMTAFGRLAPGTTLDAHRAEAETVAARLRREFPETYPDDSGYDVAVRPLSDELTEEARPTLLLLLGTTALVLLVACANVANLGLARAIRRERELGLRVALGAGRGQVLRQLLAETALLGLAGGVLGLGLAWWGLDLLVAFAALFTTRVTEVALDGWVLTYALALSLLTGLVIGVAPALLARTSVAGVLKEGSGTTTGGRGQHRVRSLLTVTQVAVSVVVLVAAGLLLSSFFRLQAVDSGVDTTRVLTAEVFPNWSKYVTPESRHQLFTAVLDRLDGPAGIRSAAVASGAPLASEVGQQQRFAIEGRDHGEPDLRPALESRVVSDRYFETVGVPLLAGRTFGSLDDAQTRPVAVVSRALAERHWTAGAGPLDARLTLDDGETWITIVGVVDDVRDHGPAEAPPDLLYLPFRQSPASPTRILVRAGADPFALADRVRDAVHAVDAEQPVERITTLEETRRGLLAPRRLSVLLLGLFAGLALLVSVTGVSAVVATSVSQRLRELGLRLALGATPAAVVGLAMRQGVALVGVGLALGLIGSIAGTRVLGSLLYATTTTDPLTYVAVGATCLAAGVVACAVPACRALRVDPVSVLRGE